MYTQQRETRREGDRKGAPADSVAPVSFQFTEWMRGHVGRGQTSPTAGYETGKRDGTELMFELTVRADDADRFCDHREHEAVATGYVECDMFGGRRPVEVGIFNLFVDSAGDANRKKMLYRLFFRDAEGNPLTLSGHKDVQDNPGPDVWKDTTTLYIYILGGHVAEHEDTLAPVLAAGVLHIKLPDFSRQLTTFRTFGPNRWERLRALGKVGRLFLGSLWEIYGPSNFVPEEYEFQREIPLYTHEGVGNAQVTVHPFVTGDKLGLSLVRFYRAPSRDVVVLIHGLTTSTDMFIMPEHYNLVRYLLDHGLTDVWTLDYRMSNRLPYNLFRHRYTMDDIALYDYPAALSQVRQISGADVNLHVICHCLGAVSFMMSMFGKAVSEVRSVIANSVALTPRVPTWSRLKLSLFPFLSEYLLGLPYLNPRWSQEPGLTVGKVFTKVNSYFHRECDVPACHMLSLMWGSGWPALYNHHNMAEITHRRGGDLYGPTSVHYYRHVHRMVAADNTAVKYAPQNPRHRALPENYFQYAQEIETPVLLTTGGENRVFTDSNIVCFQRLERIVPGRHRLKVFPRYGHQDVFMGKDCDRDIFPTMLSFIKEHCHR